jgi:hydroxymethylbilane synthase
VASPGTLVIGTRGSKLALTQTHGVADALRRAHSGLDIEIHTLQTRGDATQAANVPLSSFGEKGIFAKELEAALKAGEIDLAVHSMKDMAHTLPDGLVIAAVPAREDPRDCLLGSTLDALPPNARVGTGSVRRRALLLSRRPDLQFVEARGNVDTRLRKLQEGKFDALCLAVAGLNRLGLRSHIAEILDPEWFTPDPGQGALALEAREADARVMDLTAPLITRAGIPVSVERNFLRAMGGGCQTPLGALATLEGRRLTINAMVASLDGRVVLRETTTATVGKLGRTAEVMADNLRAQGAGELLAGREGGEGVNSSR